MEQFTQVIGLKIKLLDWENMNGLMVENMKVIGLIIACMVKAFILGQMVENMKENTFKIRKMAKEPIHG